jgi:hypothetical protein
MASNAPSNPISIIFQRPSNLVPTRFQQAVLTYPYTTYRALRPPFRGVQCLDRSSGEPFGRGTMRAMEKSQ